MSPAPAAPWLGRMHLEFIREGTRTGLARSLATAPLAVSRPFYPAGPATCHVMLLHNAGGMVAGDAVAIGATAGDDSRVVLTTASAGKIYRSTGALTRQEVSLQVAAGASLAWVPQEAILFDGARYRQDLTVELADGASYFAWDLVRFGRTARGERFRHGDYRSLTTIRREGRPLWLDRQHLPGGERACESPLGLGGWPVVGTLTWIGAPTTDALVSGAREAWAALQAPGEAGVTAVAAGLVCRYRGDSTASARRWFTAIWTLVRAAGAPAAGGLPELPACTRLT